MGTTTLTKTPGVIGGNLQFGAEDVRRMLFDCFDVEGVIGSASFATTQRASGANMSVDVGAGVAIVLGDTSVDQGKYMVRALTGANNVTVTAADLSNPRIDRLVLEIKDTDYDGSGLRAVRLRTIDGTPTAGANAATNENGIAALPVSCLEIARITVGTAAASIVNANIVDRRTFARETVKNDTFFTVSGAIISKSEISAQPGAVNLPYYDVPYVKSGAACTNGGGLILAIAAGVYNIAGHYINKAASENVTLNASATNRVWLQLTRDGSGNPSGTTWNVQTGTSVPSEAVLVAEVITGASTITTIRATHRGIIAPGFQHSVAYGELTTDSGGAGDKFSFGWVGDGICPMKFEARFGITSDAADGRPKLYLRDGAGGTGTIYDYEQYNTAGTGVVSMPNPRQYFAAFVGFKTLYMNIQNTTGTPTMYGNPATVSVKAWARMLHAPGANS